MLRVLMCVQLYRTKSLNAVSALSNDACGDEVCWELCCHCVGISPEKDLGYVP